MPRVSVVIPCYNGGAFLPGALQSLKAQSYDDFEIIIADDGSDDPHTLKVLEELDGARLVRQENKGLPAARNAGMRAASANLLLPLDCDDRLEPAFMEKMVETLDANPEKAFAFPYLRMTGDKQGTLAKDYNFFTQLFLNQLPYCMLLRREVWQSAGGYDEAMTRGYEDWEFNIRLGAHGFHGVAMRVPLFVYKVSSRGMLQTVSARRHSQLWRGIQRRHPELYRLGALLAMRREWRDEAFAYPAWMLLGLLAAHRVLPAELFNWLFQRLQRRSASARADRAEES